VTVATMPVTMKKTPARRQRIMPVDRIELPLLVIDIYLGPLLRTLHLARSADEAHRVPAYDAPRHPHQT
jgi:hypothetical protein